MTTEPMIDYEALVQEAMRGVVRSVLKQAVESGLPGDHHFYISFDTQAPGVSLSKRLKAKYRQEMTIVLQHRFWDLAVTDERFEVKLTFDGIPERLVVPFEAIKVFFDPSIRYGLQFDEPEFTSEAVDQSMSSLEDPAIEDGEFDPGETVRPLTTRSSSPRRPRSPRRPNPALPEPGAHMSGNGEDLQDGDATHADGKATKATDTSPDTGDFDDTGGAGEAANSDRDPSGAEIVSLDAFRKK